MIMVRRARRGGAGQVAVPVSAEWVWSPELAPVGRSFVTLLDELGYVRLDPKGAELLFQIITEREEKASIGLATNLPFSEWGVTAARDSPARWSAVHRV
jgi:DNA replication protein DnaC